MDTETKEKLTELQHQIEMLRTDMEANMKTMKAENESAIDRLLASNEKNVDELRTDYEKLRTGYEKLRTDIGKGINKLIMVLMAIGGIGVAVISLLI